MSIRRYKYIIKENPPASLGESANDSLGHHVRLKPSATVTASQLVAEMHRNDPVLSRGTYASAVSTLAETLGELLSDGHPVHVEGIGTFQPRLSGTVARERNGLVARKVSISGIQFVPDSQLLQLANEGAPTRSRVPRPLPKDSEVSAFLTQYFAEHERLTRKPLVTHFGITKNQALTILRRLVGNGRLQLRGSRATAHYVPCNL